MRIAHFMKGLGDHGGIATYIYRLSQAQLAAGHKVYLFDTRPINLNLVAENCGLVICDDDDLYRQAASCQLDILHLHTFISKPPTQGLPVVRTVHAHNPYCPSGSRYLKNWHQPCDRAYSLGGCLWGHVVDYCGSMRPQRFYPGFQRTWQEMQTLKEIPALANSQFVKDQMIRSGYLADNIHALPLPAPEIREYLPPPEGNIPHFLFLGRITPEKGLVWLLRSLAQVKVPYHMDIAGSGNQVQEQEIRSLAEHLGLMDKITFHGWVEEAQAFKLIQQSRALIFPSVWHEPAGFVSLEAAAVGRAVIASKVGGIPEYAVKLGNALLVEPNDVENLTKSIEHLATDWNLAKQMGLQGRRMARESFSLEKHEQEIIKLYQLAAQNKRTYCR